MGFEGGRQARDPLVSGRLYAVATPIGNLDDISPRARRVLETVAVVACEDTRRTGKLFELLGLKRPELVRLDAHTEYSRSGTIVDRIVGGIDCAVVSDAGTPVVSDPGADLVRRAIDAGIEVVAVPGPSSVLAALVVSGLAADGFTFAGFLPRKGRARDERMAVLCRRPEPTVLFESPKRVAATLKDLAVAFGPDRQFAMCRELTKMHETVVRGRLGQASELVSGEVKGEVVVVLAGAAQVSDVGDDDIVDALGRRRDLGLDRRSAVAVVTHDLAIGRKRVYDLALELDW